MGLPKTSKCAIDKLPEVQRQKVVDALLSGASLRKAAALAGISHQCVQSYKRRVVMPAIKRAQAIQSFDRGDKPTAVMVEQQTTLTRDIVRSSPFRERLEKLWQRADRSLDKAENAVRVVTDSKGKQVVIGQDLSPIAPLLNQAHKNVELLGRVTGELDAAESAGIAIQIVMPMLQQPTADDRTPAPVINIALRQR